MQNTVDVATKLLELLNYGNHEVRLAVVTNIVHVFRVHSNTTKECLKQQNEILTHLNRKVFYLSLLQCVIIRKTLMRR